MKISVVIPTYNRRDTLARTLPTVLAQDFPADQYEVVVVVDGSTDGTIDLLHTFQQNRLLRVLEQPRCGPAAARNAGVDGARGELVLFLDDDILCERELIKQHVAAHAGPDPLVVHGPMFVAPGSPGTLVAESTRIWYQDFYGRFAPEFGLRLPADTFLASNSSMRRSTFLACGGFDEHIPSKEDTELGLRLWKMGLKFRYVPTAVAYEFFGKSLRDFLRKDLTGWGRAEVFLCRKYPEYRRHSELAALGARRGWKKFVHEFALRQPVPPAPVLTVPLWMMERLGRFPRIRRAGIRLLQAAQGIVLLHSAVREAGSWRTCRREFARRLPVLLYHHVGPPRAGTPPGLTISPERFEGQVRWLSKRGYAGIRPSDWLAWCREGKPLPKKPVLLTFDDAYADLAEYALPVLRRYNFGATVLIVTGQIGGENRWDQADGSAPLPLMTAAQIREWAAQGIEFGAHSRTHPDLTKLTADRLEEEVAGSGEDLASLLGGKVVSFAYPYGPYNEAACQSARRAFDVAFTTDEGLNYLGTDLHRLRRTGILPDESLFEFACRVRWGWNPILRLRARLRVRSRAKAVFHWLRDRGR